MNNDIKGFVDTLIEEKQIPELDSDVLNQMKLDLEDRVESLINARILQNIPSDSLEEFEKKLDEETDENVMIFCKEKIPNLDEIIANALMDFRKIYLK